MVFACAAACAGRPVAPTARPPAPTPPDPHGELLALLPPGAAAFGRFDLAAARRSPHFEGALALAASLGSDLGTVQRELGFDALHVSDALVVAVYLPPGTGASAGWPVLVARGGLTREGVLAAVSAARHVAVQESTESGVREAVIGERVFLFPAPDVVVVADRSLRRRVAERLAGIEAHTVSDDRRFAGLWELAGGARGALRGAADLAAIRGRVRGVPQPAVPQADALDVAVAWADVADDVAVHAAGRARSPQAAQEIVRVVDASAREFAGQLAVRLLGLGRLLREGIHAAADGDHVTLSIDANAAEAGRLLRISSALRELGGGQ